MAITAICGPLLGMVIDEAFIQDPHQLELRSLVVIVTTLVAFLVVRRLTGPKVREHNLKLQEEWEARNALFNDGWVCLRCGHTWIPNVSN